MTSSLVANLTQRIVSTGRITLADRYILLDTIYDHTLPSQDRVALRRLLQEACDGRFTPVM